MTAHATTGTATTRTVDTIIPTTCIISHCRQGDTNKVLHRTDGPAQIRVYPEDDDQHLITVWYDHGRQKRTDGPNVTTSDGNIYWTVEHTNTAHTLVRTGCL